MNAHLLLLTALLATMALQASATEGITAGTALAIGVAAVIGLKIAGLAGFAIARSFSGRRGGRRGRRDAGVEDPMEELFQMVAEADQLDCGARVVCELEAREQSSLQADERLILSLFGSQPRLPIFAKHNTAAGKYQTAAFYGAAKKSVGLCAKVFAKCPYNSELLMQAVRSANAQ